MNIFYVFTMMCIWPLNVGCGWCVDTYKKVASDKTRQAGILTWEYIPQGKNVNSEHSDLSLFWEDWCTSLLDWVQSHICS